MTTRTSAENQQIISGSTLDRDPTDAGVTPPHLISQALAARRTGTPTALANSSTSTSCRHGKSPRLAADGSPVCPDCWRAWDRRRDPRPRRRPRTPIGES